VDGANRHSIDWWPTIMNPTLGFSLQLSIPVWVQVCRWFCAQAPDGVSPVRARIMNASAAEPRAKPTDMSACSRFPKCTPPGNSSQALREDSSSLNHPRRSQKSNSDFASYKHDGFSIRGERDGDRVPLIIVGATVCFLRIELISHGSRARGLAADVVVLPLHTRH